MPSSDTRIAARLLAALVLVALVLRAPRLSESLWYDEISAWLQFGVHGPAVILTSYADPANHIAHTLASWCSATLLWSSLGPELALRLPALLASLGAIPLIHGLAREAFGRRAALGAAAVAAVAPVAVLEGVEARGYSMVILFAAAATWCLTRALRDGGWRRWGPYALCAALGVWTHPLTAMVPAGHALWLLWSARGLSRGTVLAFVAALGLAAATTLLLYAPVLGQMFDLRRGLAATGSDQPRLLGAEGLHMLFQMGGAWSWWAALPGLIAASAGAVLGLRTAERRRSAALCGLGLVVYVAFVLAGGVWSYARFALFAWPLAALLIGAGIDALWARWRFAGLALAAITLVAWGGDLVLRPAKQPLRDAAAYVHEHGGSGARVLVVDLAHSVLALYGRDLELTFSHFHGRDIDERLADARPLWIVVYYPRSVPPSVYRSIEAAGFTQVQRFHGWVDWDNGDVLVYRGP